MAPLMKTAHMLMSQQIRRLLIITQSRAAMSGMTTCNAGKLLISMLLVWGYC